MAAPALHRYNTDEYDHLPGWQGIVRRHDYAVQARAEAIRKHPLYHTQWQQDIVEDFEDLGPLPNTFDRYTPFVLNHADAYESEVRDLAKMMASNGTAMANLGHQFWNEATDDPQNERLIRRRMRAATRQITEHTSYYLGKTGKGGQMYASQKTIQNRQNQLEKQREWIKNSYLESDVEKIPLEKAVTTTEARFSELYTLMRAQQDYFFAQGRDALFITLTTPPQYHPNPRNGKKSWNGSTPRDGHRWIASRWNKFRAHAHDEGILFDGSRTTEPHKDGAPHWHAILYVFPDDINRLIQLLRVYFGFSKNSIEIKTFRHDEQTEKGKASPITYLTKYIIKTIGGNDKLLKAVPEERKQLKADTLAVDAWRACWGIRSFQFIGLLHGKIQLWRHLRKLNVQPEDELDQKLWRAARGGRGATFLSLVDKNRPSVGAMREVLQIEAVDQETGEVQILETLGRQVGIEINGRPYQTCHTRWRIVTVFNEEVPDLGPLSIKHNCPRGGNSGKPEPPPNPIPTPQNRHEHVTA